MDDITPPAAGQHSQPYEAPAPSPPRIQPKALDPFHDSPNSVADDESVPKPLAIRTYKPLGPSDAEVKLREPIINNCLRRGEIQNIIGAPKMAKSMAALDMAFAIATGGKWLGCDTFQCKPGRVLFLDNELHEETFHWRMQRIQQSGRYTMGGAKEIDYLLLRGDLVDLFDLGRAFHAIPPNHYSVVVLDALYKFLPKGIDENNNSDMRVVYTRLDSYAKLTGAAFVVVHHSSKGSQGAKANSDVGSGAGTISRSPDTHLTLRWHEEQGAVVLAANNRSFASGLSLTFRWQWPLFVPAPDLDPRRLQSDKPWQKGEARAGGLSPTDLEDKSGIVKRQLVKRGAMSYTAIRDISGIGKTAVDAVIDYMVASGLIVAGSGRKAGSTVYSLLESGEPGEPAFPDLPGSPKTNRANRFSPLGETVPGSGSGSPCSVLASYTSSLTGSNGDEEGF